MDKYQYDDKDRLPNIAYGICGASGRLVKEGEKTYEYGWLDKVMRVAEDSKELARFEYHNNNQLAKAIRESGVETFEWDGLALIARNGTKYINEPHVGGGNPILAIGGDGQKTEAIFTDILGTSMGKVSGNGYSAIDKTSLERILPTSHRSLQANPMLKAWAMRSSSETTAPTWANGFPKTSSFLG